MPAPRPTDSRALLEHASWVRALAHRLVADHALADDLAQDTCVAALEHPPSTMERGAVHARGWLRAVLANFARQSGRASARRRSREVVVARPEAQSGPLEVLARAAAHRELVDAVMALSEPFRTAILLRFFDELPPRRIARELGVPVATVHSRVQRGLAQLRDRLDERSRGERGAPGAPGAWVSALLPLARELGPSFPLSMGALVMSAKWKLGRWSRSSWAEAGECGAFSTTSPLPRSCSRTMHRAARTHPRPRSCAANACATRSPRWRSARPCCPRRPRQCRSPLPRRSFSAVACSTPTRSRSGGSTSRSGRRVRANRPRRNTSARAAPATACSRCRCPSARASCSPRTTPTRP